MYFLMYVFITFYACLPNSRALFRMNDATSYVYEAGNIPDHKHCTDD